MIKTTSSRLTRLLATTALASLALAAFVPALRAQDKFTVTVTNDLATARPSEVITIPFKEVRARIPNALVDCIAVRDASGKIIPAQVTNFTPDARPVLGDDLLWQHNFAAGEKSATFTIERTKKPLPPFEQKTFARYIPERLDDFAWENDMIAHRMYGPGLDTPAAKGSRMISSGIDVWIKSVRYPIVNRWYLKGHDSYHVNSGEGLDIYDVGVHRGAGGLGIWTDGKIQKSHNWATWKILANGPIRSVFELTYAAWDAGNGVRVTETKRFTVNAGHNLDTLDSTFTFEGAPELIVAIGLSKPGKNATYKTTADTKTGYITSWATYKRTPKPTDNPYVSFGDGTSIGIAALLTAGAATGVAEDNNNNYILTKTVSGKSIRYYIGACWSADATDRFPNQAAWDAYIADLAVRLQHSLAITISPAPAAK